MTREDLIRMAREAGLLAEDEAWVSPHQEAMERFAALVAAASASVEREALEKIDWTVLLRQGGLVTWGDAATLADRVIAAIREHSANAVARGQA